MWAMNAVVFDIALTAYIVAALAALASLVWRRDGLLLLARELTVAGWLCHTAAIALRALELRRVPVLTLAEVVSLVIWVAVLLDLWVERRHGLTSLSAFVLPVVLALGLGLPTGLRDLALEPRASNAWILVHVALVLVGLAALVLNFGSAIMYLLQERQLKAKRTGAFYYRMPSLEALDRLTLVLALGFVRAGRAWGRDLLTDPLALFSLVMWLVYAATLCGRAIGHWHGRRAAYLSIAGFCVLLATLGAGVLFQGRHGS